MGARGFERARQSEANFCLHERRNGCGRGARFGHVFIRQKAQAGVGYSCLNYYGDGVQM